MTKQMIPRVDFQARPLSVGVYEVSDEFRAIEQHSCVCFADNLGLVAVVGRADDPEAQQWADLFAAAPKMLKALIDCQAVLQDIGYEAPTKGDPEAQVRAIEAACDMNIVDICIAADRATAAIAQARGEASS